MNPQDKNRQDPNKGGTGSEQDRNRQQGGWDPNQPGGGSSGGGYGQPGTGSASNKEREKEDQNRERDTERDV